MKRALKILRRITVALLLLMLMLFIVVQLPVVHTYFARKAAAFLSEEWQTEVSIERLSIRLPDGIELEGLFVRDTEGDTLGHIPQLVLDGFRYSFRTGNIHLGDVYLREPSFHLHRHHGDSVLNLAFITDYFSSEDSSSSSTPVITCRSLLIENGNFSYNDFLASSYEEGLVDFSDLDIRGFYLSADTASVHEDSVSTWINSLSLKDKSGFLLHELKGAAYVSKSGVKVDSALIRTPGSHLQGDIHFRMTNYGGWSHFNDSVNMRHDLLPSLVDFRDLRYFVPEFEGLERTVSVEGQIRGPVAKLRGREVVLKWDDNSSFEGDFRLEGLPDLEHTFITLDLKRLTSNKAEIDRIPLPPFTEGRYVQTPDNIARLGQIEFSGNFTGFLDEFVAFGRLDTRLGRLRSDISIKQDENEQYFYRGEIASESFDLGRFYDEPLLGTVSSELTVDGSGITLDDVNAEMKGTVASFSFNDYNYHNITVNGQLARSFFDGALNIRDENIWLDFLGTIDFDSKIPAVNAVAEIADLDPVALHFLEDSTYTSISTSININARGLDPETATGSVKLSDFSYCYGMSEYNLDTVSVIARNVPDGRDIVIRSPIADAHIHGRYKIGGIQRSILQILDEILPSFDLTETKSIDLQDFTLRLTVKDFSPVSELFIPEVRLARGTSAQLNFSETDQYFKLTTTSDSVWVQGTTARGMVLDIQRPMDLAYITLMADTLYLTDSLYMAEFALDARNETDTIFSTITWDSPGQKHAGDINSRFNLRGNRNFNVRFEESSLTLNETEWQILKDGLILIDSSRVELRKVTLEHETQFLRLNGALSHDPLEELGVDVNGFELSALNPFVASMNLSLAGIVEGEASLKDFHGEKKFLSDLLISDLEINNTFFGDLCVDSSWDRPGKRLVLAGEIQENVEFPLIFSGFYYPEEKENALDLNVELDRFDLNFLNPFLTEGISHLSGTVNARAHVSGMPEEPQLEGEVKFNNVGVRIDYLNTTYYLNERAGIYPGMFTLDYTTVKDQEGNRAKLIGTVVHDNFSDWNYDVYVSIEEGRFLAMNTTKEMNPLYYGTAYASGFVSIFGYDNNLEFDINLKAERGTVVNMPLDEPEEQTFEDFVVFVNTGVQSSEEELDLSGIDMSFKLDITPDAEFRLIFDESAGDIMRGRGTGVMNMEITSEGKFEMYGSLEVYEGDYLFTLRNLIGKEFKVERGSTISWFGDPLGADLKIRSVYSLNAPLHDLLGQGLDQYRNRVPVNLVMNLNGQMLNPGIQFEVELPSSDELTRGRVKSALSTDEELNRQAFALLVLRRFVPPPNVQGVNTNFGMAENSVEFLTSQFNSWLSQISEDFDIGFNYRPGDQITNSEVALALSTQLFNERVRLRGNFGVNYGGAAATTNQNPTNLVGDIEVETDITQDGKIKLIVFNRTNEYDVTRINQSLTTQGLGLVYQEQFDSLDEFFFKVKQLFTNEKREYVPEEE